MKRVIVYFILLAVWPLRNSAQHLEIGAMFGASNYWGDIAPAMVMSETHFAGGMFARVNLSSSFAFTASIMSTTISGTDQNFEYNKPRNINFTTPMTEYAALVEFNFFRYGVDVLDKRYTPYVFLGIAFTQFDPQTVIKGQTVQLRNIQTENKSYSGTATCLPFGMGFKWQFHRHLACDLNVSFRRSYSDYLDDVSTVYPDYLETMNKKGSVGATVTDPSVISNNGVPLFSKGDRRGNADYTDWYVTSTVSISYRFYKRTKCRRFY